MRTSRLTLTVPQRSDTDEILTIVGDPRTVQHNPSDRVTDRDDAAALVDRWIRHWHDRGFGYWCVRETGRTPVVGYCGVKYMVLHEMPVMNLIYRFHPEVWGRGYATEAVTAAVAWADAHGSDTAIIARIRPGNTPSQHVALNAGLHRDRQLDVQGEDGPDIVFSNRTARRTVEGRVASHPTSPQSETTKGDDPTR